MQANFSILALVGILLIILEMYFPSFSKKLEKNLIRLPSIILHRVFGVSYDEHEGHEMSEKSSCLFSIVGLLCLAYYIAFFVFDLGRDYPNLFSVLVWIVALPIMLLYWTFILEFVFGIFAALTNNKPFTGIGLVIALIDIFT